MAPFTASPESFNCVICFDEFGLTEQYPVVLPCGHTYVCNICAQRLERCMECREPLSFTVPPSPSSLNNHPRTPNHPRTLNYPQTPTDSVYRPLRRGVRTPAATPSSPQHCLTSSSARDINIRYPLAKNFVLMDMIEASNRRQKQQVDECKNQMMSNSSPSWSPAVPVVHDDANELDLNGIVSGMANISGPCGTYTVRERDGLFVLPNHPQIGIDHSDYKPCKREPFAIAQGQTVQVVDFCDDVAKLARDAGYIVASHSQLVKVGQPMDKSCRLEGALEAILNKERRDLQRALDKNQQMRNSLQKQLDLERTKDPSYPIIADSKSHIKNQQNNTPMSSFRREPLLQIVESDLSTLLSFSKLDDDVLDCPIDEDESQTIKKVKDFSSGFNKILGIENIKNSISREVEPVLILNDDTDTRSDITPNQSAVDHDIQNNISNLYRDNSDDDLTLFFGCGASLFGNSFLNFDEKKDKNDSDKIKDKEIHTLSFDSYHGDIGRRRKRRTGDITKNTNNARDHDLHRSNARTTTTSITTPILSNSFDTLVNFRTGMSGHRALSKTSRTQQQHISSSGSVQSPTSRRYSIRMMSQHQGISSTIRSPNRYNTHDRTSLLSSPAALGPRNSGSLASRFATQDDYDFVVNVTRR